jgi:hypothetical protein
MDLAFASMALNPPQLIRRKSSAEGLAPVWDMLDRQRVCS